MRPITWPNRSMNTPARGEPFASDAADFAHLAARLFAAEGEPAAWRSALEACEEWLGCTRITELRMEMPRLDPSAIESLAGGITHCAVYGSPACGAGKLSAGCARGAALAPLLHAAAHSARNALRALVFDHLPPVWILDQEGRVQECNAPAKALRTPGAPVEVIDGWLVPAVPMGGERLRRCLTGLAAETCFSWPIVSGGESTLLLKPLATGGAISAQLLVGRGPTVHLASHLAQRLELTVRQSELAALLLDGLSLTDAARAMSISRNTANEHLSALLRRVKVADRKKLMTALRDVV